MPWAWKVSALAEMQNRKQQQAAGAGFPDGLGAEQLQAVAPPVEGMVAAINELARGHRRLVADTPLGGLGCWPARVG